MNSGRNSSSGSLADLVSHFRRARRVVILSHAQPDGDALGSAIGLALGLRGVGKQPVAVFEGVPPHYDFLTEGSDSSTETDSVVKIFETSPGPDFFAEFDLGVVLDASDPPRVGNFEADFFGASLDKVCIDHHLAEPLPVYAGHVIEPESASTGQLVLRLLDLLEVPLDRSIATALFVAVATDTGWFRFGNTRPDVLEVAARLLALGLQPDELYSLIYERISEARLHLQGVVESNAVVELGGDFVYSCIDFQLLQTSGVQRAELEGVIDPLRTVDGSEVVALLTEIAPQSWKISLRSRGLVRVDVIAKKLGGGGHAMAAGARDQGTRDEVVELLRKRVEEALREARS